MTEVDVSPLSTLMASRTSRTGEPVRPEDFDSATNAVLDSLDDLAKKEEKETRPDNTQKAYTADWREWEHFTGTFGLPLLSVRSGTLAAFARWMWDGRPHDPRGLAKLLSPATIDRKLSGVVITARDNPHRMELPRDVALNARTLLARWVKEMEQAGESRGRGKAPALLIDHMKAISANLPDNLSGLRDRSIMCMQFAVAGREHEMAWCRDRDFAEHDRGVLADLRISKVAPRKVPVTYATDPLICPVRTLRAWREASGTHEEPDGFAWRRLNSRWHTLTPNGLSPEGIGDVITRISLAADLGVRHTGHSARAGLATESRIAGNDQRVIAAQGGWTAHSRVLAEYLRIVDQWSDNALVGVM